MRILLLPIAAFLLPPISASAQRTDFTGYYVQLRETPDDTDVHILMSLDSVTEIRAIKTKRDRDMWMEIKKGVWIIKSYDTVEKDYWLTLRFIDGSTEDLHFIPAYETFPAPRWMQPLYYQVRMGNRIIQKERGKNGFVDRIRNNINSRKM